MTAKNVCINLFHNTCIVLNCLSVLLSTFAIVVLVSVIRIGTPWEEIAIDCIGPWKVDLPPPHNTVTFNAFTIIDTTTGVLEIIRSTQQNATGQQVVDALDHAWLTRYPKPMRCIFDQGECFLNAEFNGHLVI